MKFARAAYFVSLATALVWMLWAVAVMLGWAGEATKISPWPLWGAALTLLAAKLSIRALYRKEQANG